ncbi:TetR/AcrR family transcriptional regulator [Secundilactobacillus kimchicus]|uniref:TetR/AcrR family transcriptional regulator n=1 Tax=Secundilactobacillus kimchicus TaxID=528209 RepID=UPI0024A86508|nr:TetR/AcrR family transcriptional regulator [Secundilactobacillus kimchicus]
MQDLRVIKTKMTIENAFAELILEKGLDAVKIVDVTNRAKVDRHTFYRHYKNKNDLMDHMIADFFGEFAELIEKQPPFSIGYQSSDELTQFLINDLAPLISSKQNILRVAQQELSATFSKVSRQNIRDTIHQKLDADTPEIEVYIIIGICTALMQYVVDHKTTPTKEAVLKTLNDLNAFTTLG